MGIHYRIGRRRMNLSSARRSSMDRIKFESGEVTTDPEQEKRLLEYVPREQETGTAVDISQDVQEQLSDLGYAE